MIPAEEKTADTYILSNKYNKYNKLNSPSSAEFKIMANVLLANEFTMWQ